MAEPIFQLSRVSGVPVTNDELLADLRADWQSPVDVKSAHGNASIIANNRVVFNIKGNSYRLIVAIRYDIGIIFIRFIGTHAEYDKVDAETI